jgi:Predicted nucleotide-binding protein containing TIR-like domain
MRMQIFLGSSLEAVKSGLLLEVADWIEASGHEPIRWNQAGVFPAGRHTFATLRDIAGEVDGAIFIFAEDDKVWYREELTSQPRDNVLIEYGVFSAVLGQDRVVIVRSGAPRTASDLHGITYISAERRSRAEIEVGNWLRRIAGREADSFPKRLLDSPFQASGKRSLFVKGTQLVKSGRHRVALVAKTPIVLVGCRPYNKAESPLSYELEQLEAYQNLMAQATADGDLEFVCVASRPALYDEVREIGGAFVARVQKNVERLYAQADLPGSRISLRWYDGVSPMTYLVSDDDFMIWLKSPSGNSVWITARDEEIARALFERAEVTGVQLSSEAVLRNLEGHK